MQPLVDSSNVILSEVAKAIATGLLLVAIVLISSIVCHLAVDED